MCTLSHAFNDAGLAAVAIVSVRPQAEAIAPPRALHCEFPLGRPLGRPRDPTFQRRVLDAAFALVARDDGPILEDFPDVITDATDTPLACPLPPRHDALAHPAVDEARGLRPAWRRTAEANGTTQVGRVVEAGDVPDAVASLVAVVDDGTHWDAVPWPGGDLLAMVMDIRSYYEEAALALVGHVPAARQADVWFHEVTETGRLLRRFREVAEAQDPPFTLGVYLVPMYPDPPA